MEIWKLEKTIELDSTGRPKSEREKAAGRGNKKTIGITRNLPEAYFRERNDHENIIFFQ